MLCRYYFRSVVLFKIFYYLCISRPTYEVRQSGPKVTFDVQYIHQKLRLLWGTNYVKPSMKGSALKVAYSHKAFVL